MKGIMELKRKDLSDEQRRFLGSNDLENGMRLRKYIEYL